jgi:hypothetical protein
MVRSHHPTPRRAMSNPYRNALAELHAASQLYTGLNPAAADVCPAELVRRLMEAMAASAALLAQPELPELTDEEIEEWADACSEAPLQEMDPEVHSWRRCFTAEEFSETIRAALIHWGHPTPQPEPPTPISAHDLAIQWNRQADQSEQWDSLELYEQLAFAQARAIAADRARRIP